MDLTIELSLICGGVEPTGMFEARNNSKVSGASRTQRRFEQTEKLDKGDMGVTERRHLLAATRSSSGLVNGTYRWRLLPRVDETRVTT
jgi:hypothetical protein